MSDEMARSLRRIEGLLTAQVALTRAQLEAGGSAEEKHEQRLIQTLSSAGFNQTEIAGLLGLSQSTVSRRLAE